MCNTFFLLIVAKQFTLFYNNEFDFYELVIEGEEFSKQKSAR